MNEEWGVSEWEGEGVTSGRANDLRIFLGD